MRVDDVNRTGASARARIVAVAMMFALASAGCSRALRPDEATRCDRTTGYDAIIVGAGLSGLTAAKELMRGQPDLDVLILEASDRIGGRARTLKEGPPIDLGGAWIHGVPTNPLTGIVDTLGFERVTTNLEAPFFTEAGRASPEQVREFHVLNAQVEAALREADRRQRAWVECQQILSQMSSGKWPLFPELRELCLRHQVSSDRAVDYLPQHSELRPLLATSTGPLESAKDIEQTSTVDAAEFEADDDALLAKGMGTFVETYGKGLPVCLNSPVTKVTYGADGVVVESAGGKRYQARQALVTVSTGVLNARKIQFDPDLPERKWEAIANLSMGHMQKVIIDFREQEGLLPAQDSNSWVLYKGPGDAVMAFVIRPLNKNIAIGFYGGEQALRFEQQCRDEAGEQPLSPRRRPCDEQAVRRAQEALGKMYGARLVQAVDKADIYVTRWSLDPWTLGAYSAATPDKWPMREELAKPVPYREDEEASSAYRVYFAGEACGDPIYNGSFAGAYESGLKAARWMLEEPREDKTGRVSPAVSAVPH
jgi:monoamine oxidase